MDDYKERINILSEMIAMAKSDMVVKKSEYKFLVAMATSLQIDKETLKSLFNKKGLKIIPRTRTMRIQHFYRIIKLMNVDDEQHELEFSCLQIIGLRLGFRPSDILNVISEMRKHPDGTFTYENLVDLIGSD